MLDKSMMLGPIFPFTLVSQPTKCSSEIFFVVSMSPSSLILSVNIIAVSTLLLLIDKTLMSFVKQYEEQCLYNRHRRFRKGHPGSALAQGS